MLYIKYENARIPKPPKHLAKYLDTWMDMDTFPTIAKNGTLWYSVSKDDYDSLNQFVKDIDAIPEEIWKTWDDETKMNVSTQANNALRICRNCIIKESKTAVLNRHNFYIEDVGPFVGYGEQINNKYFEPLFTKKVCDEILNHFPNEIKYDADKDVFIDSESEEEYYGKDYNTRDGKKHLYPFGSPSWEWYLDDYVDEDDEDYTEYGFIGNEYYDVMPTYNN